MDGSNSMSRLEWLFPGVLHERLTVFIGHFTATGADLISEVPPSTTHHEPILVP
jgi:hypothetical protein